MLDRSFFDTPSRHSYLRGNAGAEGPLCRDDYFGYTAREVTFRRNDGRGPVLSFMHGRVSGVGR